MSSRLPLAGLLAVLAVAGSGCVSVEMGRLGREVARDVERQQGVEVDRGFAISVGRGWIGTSRFLSRLVAPESSEPARRLGRHVRQVKMARYPILGSVDSRLIERPAALDRYRADDGWDTLAAVRDSEGTAWILYREDGDVIRDLLAVVVAPDDIVVTRMTGDLTALVLDAIELGSLDQMLGEAGLPVDPLDPDRGDPVES